MESLDTEMCKDILMHLQIHFSFSLLWKTVLQDALWLSLVRLSSIWCGKIVIMNLNLAE